jgi:hypothetical protein
VHSHVHDGPRHWCANEFHQVHTVGPGILPPDKFCPTLLAELLSIPMGDRYPPFNLTAQKHKEKTLHAQVAQVEGRRLSIRQPVLIVFEECI